jgi:hypothetical protein
MASKSHHAGTDVKKSRTKSRRDRLQSDVPVRVRTRASTTRI